MGVVASRQELDIAWISQAVHHQPCLSNVIAVVGCDGSGKTRLVHDIVAHLKGRQPTERWYMGLVSGEAGDRIKKLPFVGPRLEDFLARKVRRAQDMKKKVPGPFSAVVMYLFSLWRLFRVKRLAQTSGSGLLVIAERYPQSEIPGFHYDGPGLDRTRSSNRFICDLARREQDLYDRMAEYRPGLVLRLDVDADTAHARKPDHPLPELRDKSEALQHLTFQGSQIRDINARAPYPQVLHEALEIIEGYLRSPVARRI